MGTAGIQKALVKNAKSTRVFGSSTLVELGMSTNSFTAYIDESCLGKNTTNPQKTISEVKWFLVREHVWNNYKKLYPELGKNDFFNKLLSELDTGDYTILSGNDLNVTRDIVLKNNNIGNLGAIHMLMPYTNFPEYEVQNIFVVAVAEPRVLYTQFKLPKHGYIPLENHDKKAAYGQTVDVLVYTHLLPDWRKNTMKFEFEVELVNRGKVVSKSGAKLLSHGGDYHYNNSVIIQFLIDPEWQKNHQDKNKDEEFYLRIKGTEKFTQPTYYSSENTNFNTSEYDSEKDNLDWQKLVNGKWIYDSSRVLLVPYDTFSDMMSRFEVQKNNMIQYIGDIRYTKREFDPCGYSKITIQDKGDKERKPLVIFDETKPAGEIDKTDHIFAIIAGDERKDITITLDGLQTKNQFCQGLLLDEGQKHTEHKNVFQVDKVYSALRTKDGYPATQDFDHERQQKDAGITTTEENKRDTDVSRTNNVSNPTAAQQWKDGVDYKIESDKEIILKLRYLYNKTAFERLQKYSFSKYANEAVNSLWTLRYFILSSDANQTYFLPISTCRYPNQISKIEVYPDIEWELAALIAVPLWRKTTFKFQATRENVRGYHGRYGFKYIKRELSVEAEKEGKVGADFTLKASTSGKEYEAGYKIEKSIKKVVGTFNTVYQEVTIFDGTETNVQQSAAYKKGVLNKFEFTIDPPNVAIALKWKHEIAKKDRNVGKIGWRIEGGVALKPFVGFGITVDLVSIIGKFGWIGKAVELIIEALEYTVKGLDIFFNFVFTAEVAGNVSIGYHNLDGWDEKLKKEFTITINASLEAGVNYEGSALISTIVRDGVTYETQEELKVKASLGAGVEYKEEWDSDEKGMFKNVTVIFLGAEAKLEVYSSITRRKKTVYNNDEVVSNQKGDVKHNDVHKLLDKKIWYGPEKIYTDDDKDNK